MVVQEVDNSGDRSSSRLGSVEGLHGIMFGSSRPASAAGALKLSILASASSLSLSLVSKFALHQPST